MSNKLKDRIDDYQAISDYRLMARLPIAIIINGRSFAKLTQFLDKPYCSKFAELMSSTMLKLCNEVENTIFGYQFNDEIVLISYNNQNNSNMWYNGDIQKLCSIISSITTSYFTTQSSLSKINLTGMPLFTVQIFAVPTISEAINTVIYKQQQNFHTSVQLACLYEFLKNYDNNSIKEMLLNLSIDEKINLLQQECGVDFNQYPNPFKRGIACYRSQKVMEDGIVKNKWTLNLNIPIFSKDQAFLSNLFKNGFDIFRKESL